MIITDKILNPQTYLEIMTGKYYLLNAANQLEEVEEILDREFGKGTFWVKLVPVEIVNITDDCEQDKFCRLFQVPDDWDEDILKEKLCNI